MQFSLARPDGIVEDNGSAVNSLELGESLNFSSPKLFPAHSIANRINTLPMRSECETPKRNESLKFFMNFGIKVVRAAEREFHRTAKLFDVMRIPSFPLHCCPALLSAASHRLKAPFCP